ncbi:MAG: hypothetical protein IPM38_08225 [Ignavibacteria bacterium]|nr:hypothetical protein [Ignavibacteria bacterium]
MNLTDEKGNRRYKFETGEKIRVSITFEIFKEIEGLTFIFAVLSGLSRECLTLFEYAPAVRN